jgi:hypothetical protein
VLDPAVAVIVTDVALVDVHFNVTLCPAGTVFVFAENTRVGVPEVLPVPPPHAERLKSADTTTTEKYTLRRGL